MSSVPVYFTLFCSKPLPRQLRLLLGAFAINATKFFVSGFLASRTHNAIKKRNRYNQIIKLLCAEDKVHEAAANGTLQVRLETDSLCKITFPFLRR